MRLLLLGALPLVLLLASCAGSKEEVHQRATTKLARAYAAAQEANWHALAAQLPRKVKGDLTIINQYGSGNWADGSRPDNRKRGQRQGNDVSGDGSSGTQASKRESAQGLPWWAWLLVGAVGWDYLSSKLGPLKWLPWRARLG